MIQYEKGDIILVCFPFSNQMSVKKRPAIVISSNSYNANSLDIVIMAITSQIQKPMGIGECIIADWQNCGLLKPSVIKAAISSIERKVILKKLGRLSTKDFIAMENALRVIFDV